MDQRGKPLVVLEAKSERKHPLSGKEQARKYARSQSARFVILSNGNIHYLWDLEQGNPSVVSKFPSPDEIGSHYSFTPDAAALATEAVDLDYIVLTQMPGYANEAAWRNEAERPEFIDKNKLRFLRKYQQRAVQRIQEEVSKGATRFLFEMATGTGKTLTSAAVIKLFLRTANAKRVLFLVDRLELESQADKAFKALLRSDFTSVIYKEQRDDWRKADIVVTTVQSLLFNDKYRRLFAPTDFDLVISDEAHRSIGGNARAVFEYFIGYKLGLTATPKDYLRGAQNRSDRDPREAERRAMLDTYRTFGCESGEPTFRYSLIDGVKDGFLINPYVVDARTGVTTQLLANQGFIVEIMDDDGNAVEQAFSGRDFERRFFSEPTNKAFCRALLRHGLRDPITKEFGKTLTFAVSQRHAANIAHYLNEIADELWPGRYNSDFAMQVTSHVPDAQQMTINFANNNLEGQSSFLPDYRTAKARVCVTVGMMTTGYDCPDLLNLALMRPVFSPSEFVQIKGRGTRKHNFAEEMFDPVRKAALGEVKKTQFKLFDFFANCEFFEERFDYDQELNLPQPAAMPLSTGPTGQAGGATGTVATWEVFEPDEVVSQDEQQIGPEGMRVDRELFQRFEDGVRMDTSLAALVERQDWDAVAQHVKNTHFDKPNDYFNLEGLRRAAGVDRRITIRELVEKALGLIPGFRNKAELIDSEFQKFLVDQAPEEADRIPAIRYFFDAYIRDPKLRALIDEGDFASLNVNPTFTTRDLQDVPLQWRTRIPEYIKDYVSLNPFL
jgi:type I restriction enzyme R subunit